MFDYNPAASVPPPLQGPALPPDWHLICCDEDHGSPSRMANASNDDSYQQRRSRSALAGQAAGNFAWMSCCEDEACVSPPVEDDRQHRPHGYNFITGQPSQPHTARRDGTPCGYTDDNAPDCCVPTTDSTIDHGINFGTGFNLGSNINSLNQSVLGGLARSMNAGASTKSMTMQQQTAHNVNVSFEALLSAVVQDAANSGILQPQHHAPANDLLPASSPGSSLTPGSSVTPNSHHARMPSLQAQMLQHQHFQYQQQQQQQQQQEQQQQQQQEQQQQQQEFLEHSRNLLQAQYGQPYSAPISPLSQSSVTFAKPDQPSFMASSGTSRQPRLAAPNLTGQPLTGSRLASTSTPSMIADFTSARPSSYGSRSGTSSVVQTPSPLLAATMSDTTPSVHAQNGSDSASSTDTASCPARKVTQSDCHDHAHVRGQPVLHVCHWQNCHASFTTVQSLLQHISQSHLGLSMCVDVGTAASQAPDPALHTDQLKVNGNDGRTAQVASLQPGDNTVFDANHYQSSDMSGNGTSASTHVDTPPSLLGLGATPNAHSSDALGISVGITNLPSTAKSPFMSSLMDFAALQQYPGATAQSNAASDLDHYANPMGIAGSHDSSASALQSATRLAAQADLPGTASGGPMACLWDDCPPFDPFAHFGQQCLDEACGLPPAGASHDIGFNGTTADQAIDTTMLTCDPACTQDHAHLFPCEPSCGQEHTHIYPMHLHSYSPAHSSHPHNVQLDSATAVLKHLLQQHLGVDLTQGLLNAASQQLGDAAPGHPSRTGAQGIKQTTPHLHTSSTSSAPVSRRPSTEKHALAGSLRKPKPLKAPPRRPVEDKALETQTHVCRWHGCTDKLDSVEGLTEHLSDVHIGKGKTDYQCLWAGCEVCEEGQEVAANGETPKGRKFATRQKVMRHIQAHTGYRPFVCPICGTAVSEQATLVAHIRRHSEDRPFPCDVEGCDKTFASAASLTVHKRTHEGQKEHVCPHCDKGFVEASNLNKHIRIHTGEKPFKCKQQGCTKRFTRPDQLKRHEQIHDRPNKNASNSSENATSETEESA
ncbi:hypothetical protein QFC20_002835 [Naganishia adeliensis]|uniref:Uncharacterized protein n=1 Tax=Naganishia adeliensis TaxID=92952 RepID=A0ACC2WHU7_9TREE|nr:hypothetical protein QFC20_002835 [Naganishia adeliensis]